MVYSADTLRDSLLAGWTLTGEMEEEGGATANQTEKVHFFAYLQQEGQEKTKSIEVIKINEVGDEQIVTHPQYDEVSDTFQIIVSHRVSDIEQTVRDTAEANIEDMCAEVTRIIKTVYNPLDGTSSYFTMSRTWQNLDKLHIQQPVLKRLLNLTLTKLRSQSTEVYTGNTGALIFDLSLSSNMDTAPSGDYTYTEVNGVRLREGFAAVPYLTKDTANGKGVPLLTRGRFGGIFTANVFAKKSDLDDTPNDAAKLDNIYKMQTNGQHIEAALYQTHTDTQGSATTLTTTTVILVNNMTMTADNEILVAFDIEGTVVKPSTQAVA